LIPVGAVGRLDSADQHHTCIVHDRVETPEALGRAHHEAVGLLLVSDVRGER
jgi:hypothetical protein